LGERIAQLDDLDHWAVRLQESVRPHPLALPAGGARDFDRVTQKLSFASTDPQLSVAYSRSRPLPVTRPSENARRQRQVSRYSRHRSATDFGHQFSQRSLVGFRCKSGPSAGRVAACHLIDMERRPKGVSGKSRSDRRLYAPSCRSRDSSRSPGVCESGRSPKRPPADARPQPNGSFSGR